MTSYKKKTYRIPKESDFDGLMPPQAVEFEEAVLGAMMLESNLIDSIMANFNPNIFYKDQNKEIAIAITSLYKRNKPIDIISLINQLKESEKLDLVGGAYYISQLASKVSSSANIEYHIRILQQNALKRNLITLCSEGIQKGFDISTDVFEEYDKLVLNLENAKRDVVKYEIEIVGLTHEKLIREQNIVAEHGLQSGVPTGLRAIDNLTNGWQPSDLIIIAGRPSMGKTALMLSMVKNAAIDFNRPVAVFSCEMSKEQLVSRLQSDISGIDVSKIVKKQLTTDEVNYIAINCAALEKAKIYIDDTANISIPELKGKARRLVKEFNVEAIYVDYLQLLKSGQNIMNREQEIAQISIGLKSLAKELKIPIIALSQLSRKVEERADKKPMLQDLRESGQIEQDADLVMFCYRPEYYHIENYEIEDNLFEAKGLFMVLIEKHRNGGLGEIPLKFIGRNTKVTNHEDKFSYENNESVKTKELPDNDTLSKKSMFELGVANLDKDEDESSLPF